ncbi:MAG TPA: sigma-70 region 4 domain-containing protein [Tepidisphaeraceae bacterium]|jgi:DNA-binding MarR family transcriptional regulator|nr:sigma-70 region 4 domain-containing protein [Tepidisphaeraceae bacterium]
MTTMETKPARLTPRQQLTLHLRYVCGWRQRRIATHLGVHETAVSRLLQRAEKRDVHRDRRYDRQPKCKPVIIRAASLSLEYEL